MRKLVKLVHDCLGDGFYSRTSILLRENNIPIAKRAIKEYEHSEKRQ